MYVFVCPKWQVNVGHPSEVDEIFDAISYSKGASVIRMLHNYIGDEVRPKKNKNLSIHFFPTWRSVLICFVCLAID